MENYKAYLFDMDGTLVNSEPLKGKALELACLDYGVIVDFNIYKNVMGESWQVVTEHFFKEANISPNLIEFNAYFRSHYEHLLRENLELNPNALNYINHIKSTGKQCAVVSSAASWMVEQILSQLGLKNAFDVVITKEDVIKHKPNPEAYQLAIKNLDILASDALVFEDSTAGILAGVSSGCDVVAVKHTFNQKNDLSLSKQAISDFGEMLV
ncbi:HAD family hydrolase [Aliivibrio fischeri]|uniref:Beta-phosphoglucomutase n=2 Tax=Aliivibrio fischeri TaxID=668 RepID=B5EU44_ALIFM|nr:HAD family phosphatase [Aliivibrio fischeri]ACH64533.1 beta-phosphoglucomutase [Aliivibrio fischeri MJ11]